MSIRIIPIGFRLLVQKDSKEEVTEGGIVLAKETQDKEYAAAIQGTVISMGGEAFEDDVWSKRHIKKGSRVMFRRYAGILPNPKDESLVVINDKDIVALVAGEE